MHTSQISKSNKQLGIGAEKLRLDKRSGKTKNSMKDCHLCHKTQNLSTLRHFKDKIGTRPRCHHDYHHHHHHYLHRYHHQQSHHDNFPASGYQNGIYTLATFSSPLPLLVARDFPKGEDSLPNDLAGRGPFRVTDGPSLSGHNLDLVIIVVMITLMILARMVIMER